MGCSMPTRREFLKLAGAFLMVSVFRNKFRVPSRGIIGYLDADRPVADLDESLDFIASEIGISIVSGLPASEISYTADVPDEAEIAYSVEVLAQVLIQYPRYFLSDHGLETICIVKDLTSNNTVYGGALLNCAPGTVAISYSDPDIAKQSIEEEQSFGVSLHEIAHWVIPSLGDPNMLNWGWNYQAHTVNGVTYNPYQNWYPQGYTELTNIFKPEWFVGTLTQSSTMNPSEDQAEWSRIALSPTLHSAMRRLIETAPEPDWMVYARKLSLIKDRYYQLSGGAMGDQYFADLLAGNVDRQYFYG